MPDIHALVDASYKPYDIGQVGQLDLHIMAEILGGDRAAAELTPAWNGGIYWAGQLRSAKTPAEQASTKSLAFFYLSIWKNPTAAQSFANLYGNSLGRKYSGVKLDDAAAKSANTDNGADEQVYSTNEGPVAIIARGNLVFVSESFSLELARKLGILIFDAQGTGEMHMAGGPRPAEFGTRPALEPLSADLVHYFENSGVMKAAVDAVLRSRVAAVP